MALLAAASLCVTVQMLEPANATACILGLLLGISLYHGSFGFTGAYRRFFLDRDLTGVAAQMVLVALTSLLFAPFLATGSAFGHTIDGAIAPVAFSVAVGAFLFGIGMQLGGGCGSGTLFTVGGGDARLCLTLLFFCVGGFWGSLDLVWWQDLPTLPGVSLAAAFGFPLAVAGQIAALGAIYLLFCRLGFRHVSPLWRRPSGAGRWLLTGPWPLLLAAAILALLSLATLLAIGRPWAITWAFALWGAKVAGLFGWQPSSSSFWDTGFQAQALAEPVLSDTTSVMNIGIILGAFLAAGLAGRLSLNLRIPILHILAAIIGGLLLGYGSRIAYGCNIGAFLSGTASTSLHGWLWIAAALPGNWLGLRLRRHFRLP